MRTMTLSLLLAVGLLLAACGEGDDPAEAETAPAAAAEEAPDGSGTEEASDDRGAEETEPVEDQEAAPADEAEEAAPNEESDAAVDLAVGSTDLGEVLVDGDGMTLYLFTQDPPGESVCTDDCLAAWPPLLVDGEPLLGDGVDPSLVGTITRDDGDTQVTYDDAPLYTWASDSEPGDTTGQDVGGVWFVVAPDGTAVMDDDEDASRDPSY